MPKIRLIQYKTWKKLPLDYQEEKQHENTKPALTSYCLFFWSHFEQFAKVLKDDLAFLRDMDTHS